MPELLDKEARGKISSADTLDINFLVEAGAGSGKTQEMANRVVTLVRYEHRDISEIAAITFTRKAANELRDRIRSQLTKACNDPSTKEEEKTRLQEAHSRIHECFIGTIHSFCIKLLRERPVEAGVDPAFVPVEESGDVSILKEVWADYVSHARRDDEKDTEEAKILKYMDYLGVRDSAVLKFLELVCSNRDVDYIFKDAKHAEYGNLLKETKAAVKTLSDMINKHYGKIPDAVKNGSADADNLQKSMIKFKSISGASDIDSISDDKTIFNLFKLFETKDSTKVTLYKWGDENKKNGTAGEIKDEFNGCEEKTKKNKDGTETVSKPAKPGLRMTTIEPMIQRIDEFVFTSILYPVAETASEMYRERKKTSVELNYQDLLFKTADMLQNHPGVRKHFQTKFKTIMIDEFQDTDPIQVRIAMYLAGENHDETRWENIKPKNGSLFVVGDPKQSIYAFRRADYEMFKRFKTHITKKGNGGEAISLYTNFRSTGSLVKWYNEALKNLIEADKEKNQAGYGKDMHTNAPDKKELCGVKKYTVEGNNVDDILANDVEELTKIINHIAKGKAACAEHKDIMILAYKKEHAEVIGSGLAKNGIPVKVTGTDITERTPAFISFRDIIRMLANPEENAYVYSVMRGDFSGMTDSDIYRYKQLGGTFKIYADVGKIRESKKDGLTEEDKQILEKAEKLFVKIKTCQRYFKDKTPAAAAELIVEDLGILKSHLTSSKKITGLSSFVSLMEKIKLKKPSDIYGLCSFIDELDSMAESKIEENADIEGDKYNAVRVMNVHKAKGLEAPVVILAAPCGSTGNVSGYTRYDENGAPDKQYKGYMKLSKDPDRKNSKSFYVSPGWDQVESDADTKNMLEKNRLLYVAATRAKNMLIISDSGKSSHPWKALLKDVTAEQDKGDPEAAGKQESKPEKETKKISDETAKSEVKKINDRRGEAVNAAAKPTYMMAEPSKLHPETDVPPRNTENPDNMMVVTLKGDEEQNKAWRCDIGTAVHEVLEVLISGGPEDNNPELENLIEALASGTSGAAGTSAAFSREFLHGIVDEFKRKKLYERLQKAKHDVYTEVPFCYKAETGSVSADKDCNQNTYVTGSIDLVFKEDGEWVIVDYKTHSGEITEETRKKYDVQLQAYKDAWEKMNGGKVRSKELFLIKKEVAGTKGLTRGD